MHLLHTSSTFHSLTLLHQRLCYMVHLLMCIFISPPAVTKKRYGVYVQRLNYSKHSLPPPPASFFCAVQSSLSSKLRFERRCTVKKLQRQHSLSLHRRFWLHLRSYGEVVWGEWNGTGVYSWFARSGQPCAFTATLIFLVTWCICLCAPYRFFVTSCILHAPCNTTCSFSLFRIHGENEINLLTVWLIKVNLIHSLLVSNSCEAKSEWKKIRNKLNGACEWDSPTFLIYRVNEIAKMLHLKQAAKNRFTFLGTKKN